MKIIAMIPARYSASRFPGKLMKDLAGKPVILRTYLAALQTNLFDDVYVVTDSDVIFKTIKNAGGKVMMSKKDNQWWLWASSGSSPMRRTKTSLWVTLMSDETPNNDQSRQEKSNMSWLLPLTIYLKVTAQTINEAHQNTW